MKFRIPFASRNIEKLKKRSEIFSKKIKYKRKSKLGDYLGVAEVGLSREEYLGICFRSFLNIFFFLMLFASIVFGFIGLEYFYLYSFGFSFLFSGFVFFSQVNYPRVYVLKRQKDIERNLIPALEDIMIQLTSGIPIFSIMVNISDSGYGELSIEFQKAVKRINAGESEIDVLEDLGKKNPSAFFKRTLWQMSNGMRAGSDMSIVIQDSIDALNEEQMIQIQEYGNKLNPLIMFYMLISVIAPALSVTFLTTLSSMISLPKETTMMMFFALFIFVVLMQIMFLGIIKSKRPGLL